MSEPLFENEPVIEPGDYECCFCRDGIATIPSSAFAGDEVSCTVCGSTFGVDLLSRSGVRLVW